MRDFLGSLVLRISSGCNVVIDRYFFLLLISIIYRNLIFPIASTRLYQVPESTTELFIFYINKTENFEDGYRWSLAAAQLQSFD